MAERTAEGEQQQEHVTASIIKMEEGEGEGEGEGEERRRRKKINLTVNWEEDGEHP